MSADNGLLINLKTFKVTYYMGDGEISSWKCKTLEEAVKKAQELDDEYEGVEYGIRFINKLK
jgi:hypothetical protein